MLFGVYLIKTDTQYILYKVNVNFIIICYYYILVSECKPSNIYSY